jgi:hypothetical protein
MLDETHSPAVPTDTGGVAAGAPGQDGRRHARPANLSLTQQTQPSPVTHFVAGPHCVLLS